ncbi:MAG: HAMP domain-containing sensor histidine kinase [Bacteroidales bacterium]
MARKKIIIIVVMASLALSGLIVLQFHWVKNVLEIRNSSFDNSVERALQNTAKTIEKHDLRNRLHEHFASAENISDMLQMMDSVRSMLSQQSDSSILDPRQHQPRINHQFMGPGNMLGSAYDRNRKELSQLLNRSTLLSQLFMDMMGLSHVDPVEERLNPSYIDSVIQAELKSNDIDIPYQYGLLQAPYQSFTFSNVTTPGENLKETDFSVDLFPNNIFSEPVYLNVYFPKKHAYILSSMTYILIIALILLSLLVFSFFYTIHTIIRQKKLSEMKNDFINNMTHEFKTPISTISLACQTLNDKDIPKDETLYNNYIKIIDEENSRLGSLSEKILQTAIIENNSMDLKPEVINMHEITNHAINKIRMQVEQKEGEIHTDFQATNPIVHADRFHMTNVVFNLLDNANKYSLNKPYIEVTTRNKQDGFQLEIKDNGIGISRTNQKKIFDKLYRVPTGNIHDVKGFGLGLNYVKAILDQHNGNINLQSELHKGSTFIIFIPFQTESS